VIVVDILVVVLVALQSGQAEGHGLGGGNAELGELGGVSAVEVARAPGVNRRRSAHKTATHISVDLVIVLFRVDVTCHTSRVTVTCHNV